VPGPIYVTGALPGETVVGEVADGRMAAPEILTSSPDRSMPDCPHFAHCGGCSLQHASDQLVSEWKAETVASALVAAGLRAPVRAVYTSPPGSRRRAVLSGTRKKKGVLVGFHGRESDRVQPVPECRVVRPELARAMSALERIVSIGASRKGELKFHLTMTDNGLDLSVQGGKPANLALREALGEIAAQHGFARIVWDGEPLAVFAPPTIELSGTRVELPPGGFLQATVEGERALVGSVLEALEGARGPAVDLFSGCGSFTFALARELDVHAVETESAALFALDRAWRAGTRLHHVSTERRDLFRRPLSCEELSRFGSAVIDPPRAGCLAQARALAKSGISKIAFISCNPVTFARDAAILTGAGYRLDWVDVVDQFRWSTHVELVAAFRLR